MHNPYPHRFKTGLREKSGRPSIKLKDILKTVPTHPPSADNLSNVLWDKIWGNDVYGTCGPAAVANQVEQVTRYLGGEEVSPTIDDVYDFYRRSGNPTFDPETGAGDDGVDMNVMLTELAKNGIAGKKCLAFAEVDLLDPESVKAAIDIFGSTLDGAVLTVAQQSQTDSGGPWNYVKGSPAWGGHAYLKGAYTTALEYVITWAMRIGATATFVKNQVDQSFVVIWKENLGTTQYQQGIDQDALAAAYKALTGRDFPVDPTPPAPPAPVPPTPIPPTPTKPQQIDCQKYGAYRYAAAINGDPRLPGHPDIGEAFQEAGNLALKGMQGVTVEVISLPYYKIIAR